MHVPALHTNSRRRPPAVFAIAFAGIGFVPSNPQSMLADLWVVADNGSYHVHKRWFYSTACLGARGEELSVLLKKKNKRSLNRDIGKCVPDEDMAKLEMLKKSFSKSSFRAVVYLCREGALCSTQIT